MKKRRRQWGGFFGLGILFVAACAPLGEFETQSTKVFSQTQAIEVFTAGLSGVSEKYIDEVSVSNIALEGIRGLGAIDADLTVAEDGAKLVLSASGREVARLDVPKADDAAGWAKLTVQASLAARKASAEMKAATMEAVYEAVFDGMLSNLDIFSRYAGAKEAKRNRAKRDGFGGIGIRYRIKDGNPVITAVLENTPAEKAGLLKDDRITHVDGVRLKDLLRNDISDRLRGPTHTQVQLTLQRTGVLNPLKVAMDRAHIFPTTVFRSAKDGIVLLKVKSFNQDTARSLASELKKARAALDNDFKGLVIDLRGNPGGLLKQSVKVSNLLLSQGQIVSTRGRHADSIHHYEASGRDLASGLPIIVLIDGKSASAAEIVAAALQDRDRAVLVGTSSFGKGSVQTVIRLPNDGEITLTWSKLVAPTGYLLHGLGVLPAICTSGVKDGAQAVIRKVMTNRSKTEETFVAWRKPGLRAEPTRNRLRTSCPAQRRRDEVEILIARELIQDQTLFAQALNLTAATHQARN
ncbi:MAG: S41 family peptidase [Rhodospirillales bacterium]